MSYGLKYDLWCSSKIKSDLYSLRLLFDGYSDAEIDRNIPINPFALRKDSAEFIKGTSLDFKIREQTDFEFLSFYTNNPKYIKTELCKNLVTGWENFSFDEFASSGKTITHAKTASAGGNRSTNTFYLRTGETIVFKFAFVLTSGDLPTVGIFSGTNDYYGEVADGDNEIEITALVAGTYSANFFNNAASEWHTDGDINAFKKIWSGFVLPQQYSVPYVACPINVSFTATDGLGLLKQEDFELTGNNSELTIIRYCLDKMGLNLGYAIAIDVNEVNHDSSLSTLAQTFRNCDVEFDDEDDCYTVLEKILSNYSASITQVRNRWLIMRRGCQKKIRLLYDYEGNYETTEAAPDVLELGSVLAGDVNVRPVDRLHLDLEPGGKEVTIVHDYGYKKSFLDNYNFRLFSGGSLTGWTKNGSGTLTQRFKDGIFYAYISGYSNTDDDYLYQQKTVEQGTNLPFVFEAKVCPVGFSFSALGGMNDLNMEVRIQVKLTVGATVYYLTTDGWDTTPSYLTQTVDSATNLPDVTWSTIKVITQELPGSGTLEVRLQRFKSPTPGTSIHYLGMAFADIMPYQLLADGESYPEKSDLTYYFDDSSEPNKLDEITLSAADAPDETNKTLVYEKITRLTAAGTPTMEWQRSGDDTVYTLLQLIAKTLASENRVAKQTLKGRIRSNTDLFFDSLIEHPYNSNRVLEIEECIWDVYEETFDVTLIETLEWSDEDVTDSEENTIGIAAELELISVTSPSPVTVEASVNITVHIENNGEMPGKSMIDWRIVDEEDTVISSGTNSSARIEGGESDDDTFAVTAPDTPGTYYIEAKMANESVWVRSYAMIVEHLLTADPESLEFAYDEYGEENAKVISLTIEPDSNFVADDDLGAGWNITPDQDANTITVSPNDENTGSDITGTITVQIDEETILEIPVVQHGA